MNADSLCMQSRNILSVMCYSTLFLVLQLHTVVQLIRYLSTTKVMHIKQILETQKK